VTDYSKTDLFSIAFKLRFEKIFAKGKNRSSNFFGATSSRMSRRSSGPAPNVQSQVTLSASSFLRNQLRIGLTITNESLTNTKLLWEGIGHERLLMIVSEFPAQHSSLGERACRELSILKAQNAVLAVQITASVTQIADLTAENSQEIALLSRCS
jgi:hypothetical protein